MFNKMFAKLFDKVLILMKSISFVDNLITYINVSLLNFQSWINRWLRWRPTSPYELDLAESRVLSYLKNQFRTYYVDVGNGWGLDNNKIWTIEMEPQVKRCDTENEQLLDDNRRGVPIVLIHGFASALGLWALNLDSLSNTNRKVYAFDILGFGKSSRPHFDASDQAELELIESFERWRNKVGLNKFILLGHSFGAYLAMSYSLCYPERVEHLILADPWGMPSSLQREQMRVNQYSLPVWIKVVGAIMNSFTPLAGLRAAGPWGPKLVPKLRPDLKKKFESIAGEEGAIDFLNYIYHCNAQSNPSGEIAFKSLTLPYGWAKNPMIERVSGLHPELNLTFMYGSRSWIDRQPGFQAKYLLGDRVNVQVIQGSGHHVYADKAEEFNDLVSKVCYSVDEKLRTNRDDNDDVRADVVVND